MATTPAIIKLKLGKCLTAPTKRMAADLHAAGYAADVIRNACIRYWQRWREDNPDWAPGQRRDREGNPKTKEDGSPQLESEAYSQDLQKAAYHHAYDVAGRTCHSSIASGAWTEAFEWLTGKLPQADSGQCRSRFRWEAVLRCEISAPTFRARTIPVLMSGGASFAWEGQLSEPGRTKSPGYLKAELARLSKSQAIVALPVFSKAAGRANVYHYCTVQVGGLSSGYKEILRRIAAGEIKFADSELKFKDGSWYLLLCYAKPVEDLGLNSERTAILCLNRADARRPFTICVGGDEHIRWECGDAQRLKDECDRLEKRRMELRDRYRTNAAGRKGRGQKRMFREFRRREQGTPEAERRFGWKLANEVVRFCEKYNCGKVIYLEPGTKLRARDLCWFRFHGCPMDWTKFLGQLKHKMKTVSVEFTVTTEHTKEFVARTK
jgi:hypothetical protein